MRNLIAMACGAILLTTAAQAASISSLNINDLTFDIQTETPIAPNVASYTGVSGFSPSDTVGWTVESAFDPLSDVSGTQSFSGFGSVPAQSYEHVHVHGFTINFDTAVDSLLFVVENDNSIPNVILDLGISAVDAQGQVLPTGTGFQITTGNQATWILYEFDTAVTTVTSTPGSAGDGFDMAFFAQGVTEVPLPASVPLLGAGLGALMLLRRRRKT